MRKSLLYEYCTIFTCINYIDMVKTIGTLLFYPDNESVEIKSFMSSIRAYLVCRERKQTNVLRCRQFGHYDQDNITLKYSYEFIMHLLGSRYIQFLA